MKNHLLLTLRKFLFAILAFSIIFLHPQIFVHAEGSINVTEMSATATVGDSKLNVRSGPGKDYEALGSVSPGEALTVTGQTDSWYRIDYNGKEGYVSSKYVTISSSDEDTSSAVTNDPNDFSNYEEGSSQHDNIFTTSPKLLLLLAVIIIVVIIMVTTIIMIRKNDSDDDEYDDDGDEYDDDEYDDDDDDEYGDDDDDEYGDDDDDDEYEEKPIRRRNLQKNVSSGKKNASPPSSSASVSYKKSTPSSSTRTVTEEDYRLDIDPRIFDDEPSVQKTPVIDKKAQELDAAMSKLEELQQEIERLKNS